MESERKRYRQRYFDMARRKNWIVELVREKDRNIETARGGGD